MRIDHYSFGHITIDGIRYESDVIIEGGVIRKRKKKASKDRRDEFGHTPLTVAEDLPWNAGTLWIGTGAYGRLPVLKEVGEEAERRGVTLVVETTPEIVERVNQGIPDGTAVLLHLTC